VTTGIGAVVNTAQVEEGATAVVFGLAASDFNVIQGLRLAGADMIIGVDLNPSREEWGRRFGMTHFVNATEVPADQMVPHLVNMTKRRGDLIGGADYTFDCTGNVKVMRQALEAAHRGWGGLGRDWRGPRRGRDRHAPLPARHGAHLEGHRPSAARADARTCRRSWTGTWTARSRSTR
jgi:hypothetical protein